LKPIEEIRQRRDSGEENAKKRGRQPFDRPFELGFGVCFQQNVYAGVGVWLRDTGRGPQKDREIWRSGDRVIGKPKT